ncbi:hypothetical protein B0I35DRAFT_440084 [Stachybotrys elegans]|uniref:DH domain-containing protein n=1 Tax=Stachybotrys elegans TaxID=80388 RepID=A0A8K0SDZ4_9HYPO|nr:hypothetical protein B0I35DRAFT_440084 [Stachybotrys elegans]
MGVALDKLRSAHKRAPGNDLRRLVHWAHGVVPIYNSYVGAWRLGFQDLVVNLAPAADRPDDEDSLLDALPRNEKGDIVNADGERVDVAHLLKRPLLRLKQMAKFLKCVDSIMATSDTQELLSDFENLQEKARRRHREEVARMTDEEAAGTDTTRARDIRTLCAADSVFIDPVRQVNAKDIFSLELEHSNGQRLECKVELVHRDNQSQPDDRGDLLIREIGDGRRTYLLFEPISMTMVSARTGDGEFDMVVMIRGNYMGKQWHELLTLTSDNEDQILDWLDILPVSPMPPREPEPSVVGTDLDLLPSQRRAHDVPVGVRYPDNEQPQSPTSPASPKSPETPARRAAPSRYHDRIPAAPTTPPPPPPPQSPLFEKTPTQDDYQPRGHEERSRSLSESMRPDPLHLVKKTPNSSPYREDGAPPPPVHRTLGPPTPSLQPPSESKSKRALKRRQSSPLKHEYLPSDVSSASESSITEESELEESELEGSEPESSDDEIESIDIPETELGVSIKQSPPATELGSALLPVADSECSLTPSNSASQAGLHGPKVPIEDNIQRFVASVSRWSDKGAWKNIWESPCSITVTAGMIEVYTPRRTDTANDDERPLLGLDLTPLVLIRQSTALDLEIRSSVQPHCQLAMSQGGGNFRFRCSNGPECFNLYMAVHNARLNNQKFIQLENEARFKSFGERKPAPENDDDTSSRRRSWFGRKNSYRSSVRAPSQSHDGASTTPSSNVSATSFLKRITGASNPFNIARSSVDKQARSGGNSLYTSGSSSFSGTPPRSPSVSVNNSARNSVSLDTENIRIRLHLLVTSTKWEDYGNCILQIRRPPPGWHQALRADHGLEKRITVTKIPKKDSDKPTILLDAVLGSGCFSAMGSRGIVCGVWEEPKSKDGEAVPAPATGATGGNIKKWCFQCASVADASWVLRLVHQEVVRA